MRPNPKYFIRLQHNVLTVLIRPAHYAADVQGLAAALSMTVALGNAKSTR